MWFLVSIYQLCLVLKTQYLLKLKKFAKYSNFYFNIQAN